MLWTASVEVAVETSQLIRSVDGIHPSMFSTMIQRETPTDPRYGLVGSHEERHVYKCLTFGICR